MIIDAFGGDNAPLCVLKGCALALSERNSVNITCVGNEEIIKKVAIDNNISLNGIDIVNAPDVISFNDPPMDIMKKHSDCSMAVGLKLLSLGKGDVFISAGSTGALVVGGSLIVKRLPGIKRSAIAALFPSKTGKFMLIDSGANYDCRPLMLQQFAVIGSELMQKIYKVTKPRVGILNIGEEAIKGTDLQRETFKLLSESLDVNFVGNIEPQAAFAGKCDVLVSDGFSGNILLKSTEATSKFLFLQIKDVFYSNIFTKFAAAILKSKFLKLKSKLDPSNFGGAPLIGLLKPVIKVHGNANEFAIKNAVLQAVEMVR